MCRAELPPGPKQLFEDAARRFFELERRVDRGEVSWGALTKAQKLEMDDVVGMWRSAADQGHADSQFNLGVIYRDSQGVKQDDAKALKWFLKAAEQGYGDAQLNLGSVYHEDRGVKQDDAKALSWFQKAAEQGHATAQLNLGTIYHYGQGVQQDYAKALSWMQKAAEQGYANAQYNLGISYHKGKGVQQDYAKALNWYLKAAEQEHATAQYNIGCIYTKGQGVNQDFAKAVNWFRKAADQGFDGAKEAVLGAEGALRKQRQVPPRATTVPRSPSTPKCANCGVAETAGSSVTLKPCSRCKAVVYCGKACQAAHWKAGGHRAVCK